MDEWNIFVQRRLNYIPLSSYPFLLTLIFTVVRHQSHHSEKEIVSVTILDGQTPGSTIHAQQGDTVIVEVYNGLITENTAIHWHGIRQIDTPWSDGTEVTQCVIILPGQNFICEFVFGNPGTYMYHGHYGMQMQSKLFGMIVVAVADSVVEPFSDSTYGLDKQFKNLKKCLGSLLSFSGTTSMALSLAPLIALNVQNKSVKLLRVSSGLMASGFILGFVLRVLADRIYARVGLHPFAYGFIFICVLDVEPFILMFVAGFFS